MINSETINFVEDTIINVLLNNKPVVRGGIRFGIHHNYPVAEMMKNEEIANIAKEVVIKYNEQKKHVFEKCGVEPKDVPAEFYKNGHNLLHTFLLCANISKRMEEVFGMRLYRDGKGKAIYYIGFGELDDKGTKEIVDFVHFKESPLNKIVVRRHGDWVGKDVKPFKNNEATTKDFFAFQKKYIFKNPNPSNGDLRTMYLTGTERIYGRIRFHTEWMYEDREVRPHLNLHGDATRIRGDISNIYGQIHPDLCGDVSGLVGNITNIFGDATGIRLNLSDDFRVRKNVVSIQTLAANAIDKRFKLLSNEENNILMKVWSTLCHQTIGVTDEERELFDTPIKANPPFSVDKWGRHYKRYDADRLIVYSINPADIMLAKDVNKCSTCFCLHSEGQKWKYGMKCLIALDSVNRNLGVAFIIKTDSVKRLNQFRDIKFKWYDPERASFFQYDSKNLWCWNGRGFNKITDNEQPNRDNIQPLYGHDGMCSLGHERQNELAYFERFTKDDWRWYRGDDPSFPLVNNKKDFYEKDISKEWKRQINIANDKAVELIGILKG